MGKTLTVTKISLTNYGDTVHDVRAFTLQTSSDCGQQGWTDVTTVDDVAAGTRQPQEFGGFEKSGRYWRLLVTGTHSGWPPFLAETGFPGLQGFDYRTTDTQLLYRWDLPPVTGRRFRFEAQARHDVTLALSTENQGLGLHYEVIIGGWGNTQSAILRPGSGGLVAVAQITGMSSPTEYRGFWVSWAADGTIAVGRDNETEPFMQWGDPDPLPIGYVGYRTGWGSNGRWRFPLPETPTVLAYDTCQTNVTETGGEIHNPQHPQASSVSCENLITVGTGNRVELTFRDPFSVEPQKDCKFDYVELFDLVGDAWESLGKFCGRSRPRDVISSTGNVVKLVFRTDDSVPSLFSVAWQPGGDAANKTAETACNAASVPDDDRGWKQHGSFSFKVVTDERQTYAGAKTACAAEEGAWLAIVKDQATHDFIVAIQSQEETADVFIGLNDIATEGSYLWEDGSPIGDFHPWAPGQPNNYNGQDCIAISHQNDDPLSQWCDDSCDVQQGYVCQKKTITRKCEVVASGSGGEVQSPQYPQPSDASCEALVTVGRTQRVKLTFTTFSVESPVSCGHDYVELFDAVGDSWRSLGKFCGTIAPDSVCASGGAAKIVFYANSNTPSSFSLAWQPEDVINPALAGCIAPYVAEAITCPPLTAPANGNMTSTDHSNTYQDEVQFTCDAGFIVEGAAVVRCRADGRWTSMLPTCSTAGAQTSPACMDPMGMEDGSIPDSSITASSVYRYEHRPYYGRLNSLHEKGAWVAGANQAGQWLQVDLGGPAVVHGVVTQGRRTADQWVTSYKLQRSWKGTSWTTYTGADGTDKIFTGNSDRSSPVTNLLSPPMPARCVRFVVQTWMRHVCMRVEVLGCRDEAHEICSSPLGMESGNILDNSITASSVHEHCPIPRSRLNSVISWCALENNADEWLQIDLGLAIVSGVIAQGRGDLNQWVTSYKLQFSTGGASGNWTTYQESDGVDKVFTGNVDNTTPVRHLLPSPVTTRYVRFVPVTWHWHISMRVEVLGCYDVAFGPQGSAFLPEDCQDIHLADPDLPSGPYTVFPWGASSGLLVYCDMETDGGGWTVFQRRQDGSVDFYLYWDDYRAGFPSQRVSGEFWLGNDNIHLLTSQKDYVLRVDLEAVDGASAYAVYDSFTVADESDKYRVAVGSYSGTAGDAMAWHNGMRFSTRDSDSDTSALNCAVTYIGAWWYNGCHHANLNGMYGNSDYGKGVNWVQFKGDTESLAFSEMKIRPKA
ncbi:uncharacterized protein LOC144918846 isoform X2 [Branchiostoma floridae x Branchiostoma belcheri]